jgi:4-hydroxybenzoate polyprenyltransferase
MNYQQPKSARIFSLILYLLMALFCIRGFAVQLDERNWIVSILYFLLTIYWLYQAEQQKQH